MKLTIHAAAIELKLSRETIARALKASGLDVKPKQAFTLRQIHNALAGDLRAARTRAMLAEAERREMANKERTAQLVSLEEVEKILSEYVVLPLRARLMSIGSTVCTLANPTDPDMARRALDEWRDETLKLLRDKLPRPAR